MPFVDSTEHSLNLLSFPSHHASTPPASMPPAMCLHAAGSSPPRLTRAPSTLVVALHTALDLESPPSRFDLHHPGAAPARRRHPGRQLELAGLLLRIHHCIQRR
ncbi:unnamed protein product [Urochloa humidicola]